MADDQQEGLLPTPADEVPLRPASLDWPHAQVGLVDALLIASQQAYASFFAAVEHARAHRQVRVQLQDPAVYRVGKYAFDWSTFVHGLRRGRRRRDRTYWTDRGLLVPFEHLRRTLAQSGIFVVLTAGRRPVCQVFDDEQIRGSPEDFTVIDVHGSPRYVYKHDPARRNFYNIVPF